MVDQNLKFDEHVIYLHTKTVKWLGVLRRSRRFLDQGIALTLFKSLVVLHFTCCGIIIERISSNKLQVATSADMQDHALGQSRY